MATCALPVWDVQHTHSLNAPEPLFVSGLRGVCGLGGRGSASCRGWRRCASSLGKARFATFSKPCRKPPSRSFCSRRVSWAVMSHKACGALPRKPATRLRSSCQLLSFLLSKEAVVSSWSSGSEASLSTPSGRMPVARPGSRPWFGEEGGRERQHCRHRQPSLSPHSLSSRSSSFVSER